MLQRNIQRSCTQKNYIQKVMNLLMKQKYQKKDKRKIYISRKKIMEYQKTTNLLDNTSNQPSKFRAKN